MVYACAHRQALRLEVLGADPAITNASEVMKCVVGAWLRKGGRSSCVLGLLSIGAEGVVFR